MKQIYWLIYRGHGSAREFKEYLVGGDKPCWTCLRQDATKYMPMKWAIKNGLKLPHVFHVEPSNDHDCKMWKAGNLPEEHLVGDFNDLS